MDGQGEQVIIGYNETKSQIRFMVTHHSSFRKKHHISLFRRKTLNSKNIFIYVLALAVINANKPNLQHSSVSEGGHSLKLTAFLFKQNPKLNFSNV